MRRAIIAGLLSLSLASTTAFAGPSTKSDKVITGLIVGATAAALVAAIAHADEVKVYQHPPKHFKPRYERDRHFKNDRHWRDKRWHPRGGYQHYRRDWHSHNFEQHRSGDRYWRH